MALSNRGGQRFNASIWPGFVDAMTALLLVLMFVLTIFMIVQFILRETITTQDTQLNYLSQQVASLAEALGLEHTPWRDPFAPHPVFEHIGFFEYENGPSGARHDICERAAADAATDNDEIMIHPVLPRPSAGAIRAV